MIDSESLKQLLERCGPPIGIGFLAALFGVALILDPSYDSWRFGRLDFGEYGYIVGVVFVVFGVSALLGGIANTVKFMKQK